MKPYRVAFWVPGEAKSERKRQRIVTLASGRSIIGARTDEPERKDWKAWVRLRASQECPEPMHGPLSLSLTFVRRSPASTNKKPTEKRPWPWAWMTKPDCDNLAKPVKDAMNGVAWIDDAQVVSEHIVKLQGPESPPGVWVVVEASEQHTLGIRAYCTGPTRVGCDTCAHRGTNACPYPNSQLLACGDWKGTELAI